MKQISAFISLFLSSIAFAGGGGYTGSDASSVDSNQVRSSTNSSDRYNNLDIRSNSVSSPSFYGAENNRLGEPEYYSRMTGSSSENTTLDWQREAGNPTTDWERSASGAPGYHMNRATGGSARANMQRAPADYHQQHPYQNKGAINDDANRAPVNSQLGTLRNDMEVNSTADSTTDTSRPDWNRSTGGSSTMDSSAPAATTGAAAGAGNSASMTAEDTARNESATDLVTRIRREITSQSELSVNAHNVKIINQNGQIYLKGPVANMTEKNKVEEIAKRLAGNTNVVNQVYVQKK